VWEIVDGLASRPPLLSLAWLHRLAMRGSHSRLCSLPSQRRGALCSLFIASIPPAVRADGSATCMTSCALGAGESCAALMTIVAGLFQSHCNCWQPTVTP
jgi:hypothetical protein